MNRLKYKRRVIQTHIKTRNGTKLLKHTERWSYVCYDNNDSIELYKTDKMSEIESDRCNGIGVHKNKLWAKVPYDDSDGMRWCKKIWEDKFISYEAYYEYKYIEPSDVSMERLIKELSAEEFIRFMKDNGFGAERIK